MSKFGGLHANEMHQLFSETVGSMQMVSVVLD